MTEFEREMLEIQKEILSELKTISSKLDDNSNLSYLSYIDTYTQDTRDAIATLNENLGKVLSNKL